MIGENWNFWNTEMGTEMDTEMDTEITSNYSWQIGLGFGRS